MAQKFVGTWKMVESENFDDYLKALGVGFAIRQVAGRAKPTMTISVDADGTITLSGGRKDIKFKLNEEFEETTGDDRQTKNVVSMDNGKMVQRQKWDGKETTIVREFVSDNKFVTTFKLGDVVSKRTFEKQA
ncbi:fatty acid-binding protein, heart-like [Sardina pilchardus]|uniref:fatty acid-binding protein, heart-like n=1 Tax=Sardina pilchardus TaxID=27697 RepID=UPI002E0E22B4